MMAPRVCFGGGCCVSHWPTDHSTVDEVDGDSCEGDQLCYENHEYGGE
jgi:hypothetical protein